jgi:hypothetical protein
MSITFIELSKQLEGLAQSMTGAEQGRLMFKLGSDALGLIKQRVQEKGETIDGGKFPPYSTKPMLIGSKSFVQQAAASSLLGSKPKRKELEWRTVGGHRLAILEGGYKKLRELQGRQTGFVDFTMTGRMLGNAKVKGDVKVTSDQPELNSGVVTIKATQELEKKKLSGLTERKGEILALSKKEITQLTGYYEKWVSEIVKKNGFK